MSNEMTKDLPNGQQITLSGSLKMREFREMARAEAAGDMDKLYPVYARLIKRWTVVDEETGKALDPSTAASYDDLTLGQFKAVSTVVAEYLSETLEKN